MKERKGIKVLLIIMAMIAMCGLMAGCSKDKDKEKSKGNSYETPISDYFEGMQKADVKTYNKAYPDFYNETYAPDEDDMDKLKKNFEEKYGKNYKISYEIKNTDDISSSDLENVQKYIEKRLKKTVKIDEGKEVKVKATIKGDVDEDTDTTKMYSYKIDGEWKLFDVSPSTAKAYVK